MQHPPRNNAVLEMKMMFRKKSPHTYIYNKSLSNAHQTPSPIYTQLPRLLQPANKRPTVPRQPGLVPIGRHALDSPRRLRLPLDQPINLPNPAHPIRNIPLDILDPHRRLVPIFDVDHRHHRDPPVAQPPQIRAPRLGLSLRTLVPFIAAPEPDGAFEEWLRREDRGAVPAREDLERFPEPEGLERQGIVGEDVPGGVPGAVRGDVEEGVTGHAAGNPDVVEGGVPAHVRPVHAADHVGGLVPALVDQFEYVLGADGHVVEKDDCRAVSGGRAAFRALVVEVQERLQGLVAELGEGLDAVAWVEAIVGLGVDVARAKEVFGTYAFDFLAEK